MEFKRIISVAIGLPIVILVLIIGNKYLIDAAVSIAAMVSLHEFYKVFSKKANPIKWIGYLSAVPIIFIHFIPLNLLAEFYVIMLLAMLLIAFIQSIATKMKYNINDIAITFIGIVYVVLFLSFVSLIAGMEKGKMYIWIIFIIPWLTDTFAYYIGRKIGKHKMSQISPKKSWEGAIAGVFGAVASMMLYTYICNSFFGASICYLNAVIITIFLSIISQIGDFAASSIKRYAEVKDFGNLLPGHGGLLDRIDSIVFCAPFLYFSLLLFIK